MARVPVDELSGWLQRAWLAVIAERLSADAVLAVVGPASVRRLSAAAASGVI